MVSAGAVSTLSVTSLAARILPCSMSCSLLPLLLVLLTVLPELLADSSAELDGSTQSYART